MVCVSAFVWFLHGKSCTLRDASSTSVLQVHTDNRYPSNTPQPTRTILWYLLQSYIFFGMEGSQGSHYGDVLQNAASVYRTMSLVLTPSPV